MAIALIIPDRKLEDLQQRLQQALPATPIEIWPNLTNPADITFAVLWKQPAGVVATLPGLKALQSFGAGVDGILADDTLPALPLARIVDPALTAAMLQYLTGIENYYRLRLDTFGAQQQQKRWQPKSPRKLQSLCVLGLGELGAAAALHFQQQGYQVSGWARSPKNLPGITCYAGSAQLTTALANADLVICLLPLTAQTESMLNAEVFAMMKPGAIFINVARGAIVDDDALLAALDSGQLQAACLDVFREEPLPPTHAFWSHPAILVTPHTSAVTRVETVVAQIAENYRRSQRGLPLLNQVDLTQGY
ncbi:glyoxylate/hydroxypyruvate reductase A [Alishewanella longhuensis]|uniref:Glyoxylate/hydroxypyruvate reductase A n=1 Tax=Alishewanella longhuensis TaxID=1091037 RepID=A0ABQ3L1S2_9ALTE|nr:glyoxylate/hydroxypyruvate reductase A [Alishewanella longhuensis]GHG74118.1 glyoxylate/hydroxypyruvate reductase A [Alishewanella longhuensis]